MRKVILWTSLSVFFITLLQTAVFSHISFFTVLPDLVLLTVIYIAISNGSLSGLICGFIAGLLADFLSASPIGLHSFIFTLTGYIVGKFYGIYNLNKIIFPCVLGGLAFLSKVLLLFILKLLFGQNIHTYNVFSLNFAIESAVNILFAPLVFLFFNLFPQAFKSKEYGTI
ncbi:MULTISPECIES: rod shape-determining protein MreD [unclassified Treponema]|uniref:rod shape-determining protein MreD n=1 Tax=unclassified Treponema TaxID=2638727 RepID=UPI0020A256F8|nr:MULTISPECIES: rod shape-determining protein MreD [unclassified Treponema]UTC67804.1 rod shape-determining protein MreD [Treponema sp. OMZ 789]UTC70529.1 rod shape-determining protein MreD [Treponema sp. OMZ 790]UTC73241.1 rod shape-determining protein MreD [Treponema sp. OMZ 791]